MNISKELLEKAKTAKSAEELLAMAKAEKVELSDEELDNVSGGCGGRTTCAGVIGLPKK